MSGQQPKIPVTRARLVELVTYAARYGNAGAIPRLVEEWATGATEEIVRLKDQRDDLLDIAERILSSFDRGHLEHRLGVSGGDEQIAMLRAAAAKAKGDPA